LKQEKNIKEQGDNTMKIQLEAKAAQIAENNPDIIIRKISVMGKIVTILFLMQLTDREKLSDAIIKPLVKYNGKEIGIVGTFLYKEAKLIKEEFVPT